MTVPPGWYAVKHRCPGRGTTRRILQSGNYALTPLLALRGPARLGTLGEGISLSKNTPAARYPPRNYLCAPDKPAKAEALEASGM